MRTYQQIIAGAIEKLMVARQEVENEILPLSKEEHAMASGQHLCDAHNYIEEAIVLLDKAIGFDEAKEALNIILGDQE